MPLGVFEKSGRPFGFCLIARKHEEGKLLSVMAAYEASFPPRAVPSLVT
jgi:amidase